MDIQHPGMVTMDSEVRTRLSPLAPVAARSETPPDNSIHLRVGQTPIDRTTPSAFSGKYWICIVPEGLGCDKPWKIHKVRARL